MRQFVSIPASPARLAATALVLALAVWGLSTAVTGAIFTGSATATANAFTTGTVKIAPGQGLLPLNISGLRPGDRSVFPLTVRNDGTLQFRYTMSVQPVTYDTPGYQTVKALYLTVRGPVTGQCTDATFNTTGTLIYGPDFLGGTSEYRVAGRGSRGPDTGDRILAASASETLCLRIALPVNASPADAGVSADLTLRFMTDQTRNNP